MKKVILIILFTAHCSLLTAHLFAQPVLTPYWLLLELGKQKYRDGDYGGALMSFEDARRNRTAMYEQMENDLIHLLSINEVRRLENRLDFVERYANERYYYAAIAALQELYYRVPKESLRNSATEALDALGRLKEYPEAEYWIGEVYRVEGELFLALSQFKKAYEMRANLENPGFALELLYEITGVLLTRQEYNEMIRVYNAIINDHDTLWVNANAAEVRNIQTAGNGNGSQQEASQQAASQQAATQQAVARQPETPVPYALASASFASQAMTTTLERDGINRFLELYRYNNRVVERAHRELGFFYAVTGRILAQQHLMYAFLIQNSIIIEEIIKRQYDFSFTTLAALTPEINKNALLRSYIEEVEYYKTAYYLGMSLYRNGKPAVARNFWSFLASVPQAGEWHNRALMQLRNPQLEPAVEMP
jgi:hypothetical protein